MKLWLGLGKIKMRKPDPLLRLLYRDISKYPVLTLKEEQSITTKMTELIRHNKKESSKYKDLKDRLIRANLRLVILIAKFYQKKNKTFSFMDLISYGNVGLVYSADKYDPSRGIKFISYAHWWIRQSILFNCIGRDGQISYPHYLCAARSKYYNWSKDFIQTNNRNPSDKELCEGLGISQLKLDRSRVDHEEFSMDAPMFPDSIDIKRDHIANLEKSVIDQVIDKDISRVLKFMINKLLTPKEKEVIEYRYGFANKETLRLKEIGKAIKVSKERARQIESMAYEKMKEYCEVKHHNQLLA